MLSSINYFVRLLRGAAEHDYLSGEEKQRKFHSRVRSLRIIRGVNVRATCASELAFPIAGKWSFLFGITDR